MPIWMIMINRVIAVQLLYKLGLAYSWFLMTAANIVELGAILKDRN